MANKKTNKKEVEEKETAKKKTASTKKEASKKEEIVEKVSSEVQTTGISEFTKGLIIGVVITAFIALIVILLILGKSDGNTIFNGGSSSLSSANASDEMKKFYEYYERKEPTLIVYASSQCGYCELQKPILERIAELYDIDYLFMDLTQLTGDGEFEKVGELLGTTGNGTPTSVIIKDGEVITSTEGMAEGREYVKFLISGGILKSDATYQDEDTLVDITYDRFTELLKSKSATVVLMDQYTNCGSTCLEERKIVNDIAKENNIPVYYLSGYAVSGTDFVENLGSWGYSTDSYKENKSVGIPLLMVVRNGKIIWHQDGTMTEKDIRSELKNNKVIK